MTTSAPQRYLQSYNRLGVTTQMADYEIDEIRRIRREISARFDHDVDKLIAHYQALEEEYRKSGKYKFVDPPDEKPEATKSDDEKAAD